MSLPMAGLLVAFKVPYNPNHSVILCPKPHKHDGMPKIRLLKWSGSVHRLFLSLKYTKGTIDCQIFKRVVSAFSHLPVKYLWAWHEESIAPALKEEKRAKLKSRVVFPYNDLFIGKKFARKYSWKSWISFSLIRDHNTGSEEGEEHCGFSDNLIMY